MAGGSWWLLDRVPCASICHVDAAAMKSTLVRRAVWIDSRHLHIVDFTSKASCCRVGTDDDDTLSRMIRLSMAS